MRPLKFAAEGIDPFLPQLIQFVTAHLQQFVQLFSLCHVFDHSSKIAGVLLDKIGMYVPIRPLNKKEISAFKGMMKRLSATCNCCSVDTHTPNAAKDRLTSFMDKKRPF